jgi:GDSL-like Lipase/Acylhydrolase family
VVATGSATKSANVIGVGFLDDFTATFDLAAGRLWLLPVRRAADGSVETYGYLPERGRAGIVAGAVMRNGPAEAVGLAVGDRITNAGGRSLESVSRAGLCAAYSAAASPLRPRQRIVFEHAGRQLSGELLAVELGPGRLARPPPLSAGAPRTRPVSPRDRSVFVDGDSLAVGMLPFLSDALPGWRISSSAETGRNTAFGLARLRERARSLPPYVVVSLGTNDDSRAVEAFRGAIEDTVSITGPNRCVIWFNIVRPPFAGTSYAGLNRVLDEQAAAHPNLVVVDWASVLREHPEWLAPDRVHLTPDGYRARAHEAAVGVRQCR